MSLLFPHVFGETVVGFIAIRAETTFAGFNSGADFRETEDTGCSIRCIIQSAAGIALWPVSRVFDREEKENLNLKLVILNLAVCQLLLQMACGPSDSISTARTDYDGTYLSIGDSVVLQYDQSIFSLMISSDEG